MKDSEIAGCGKNPTGSVRRRRIGWRNQEAEAAQGHLTTLVLFALGLIATCPIWSRFG